VPIAHLNTTQDFIQSSTDSGAFVVRGDDDTDQGTFQLNAPKNAW
jgi:hypothetical protein